LTVIVGGSFGAGNYALCGKAFDPRLIFAWPNARCAVMGSDQATKTLLEITIKSLQREGRDVEGSELEALRARVAGDYEKQMEARYGAARGWVDALIDPAATRHVLAQSLEIVTRTASHEPLRTGVLQV
jgi:acetyl-CoA carboxylase carboxyltransferase component